MGQKSFKIGDKIKFKSIDKISYDDIIVYNRIFKSNSKTFHAFRQEYKTHYSNKIGVIKKIEYDIMEIEFLDNNKIADIYIKFIDKFSKLKSVIKLDDKYYEL